LLQQCGGGIEQVTGLQLHMPGLPQALHDTRLTVERFRWGAGQAVGGLQAPAEIVESGVDRHTVQCEFVEQRDQAVRQCPRILVTKHVGVLPDGLDQH
jgi:hypothetical protein